MLAVRNSAAARKPTLAVMRSRCRHADAPTHIKAIATSVQPTITSLRKPVIPYTLCIGGLWREFAALATFGP